MNDELKTQLTAWALDELPPDEHAATEARLSELPEARAYAEETRQFCTLLTQSLGPSADTTLTPEQRAELAAQFRSPQAQSVVRFRPITLAWMAGLGAVAAALVVWSGRFLGPGSPTVAVLPASHTIEGQRRSGASDPALFESDAPAETPHRTGDNADWMTRGLGRQDANEPPAEAASVDGANAPLVAEADDSLRFGGSKPEGLAKLVQDGDPAGALGLDRMLSTREAESAAKDMEKAKEPAGAREALSDLKLAENLASGVSPAQAPPAAPETAPTPAPLADMAVETFTLSAEQGGLGGQPGELRTKVSGLSAEPASGRALGPTPSRGAARPDVAADFDAGVAVDFAGEERARRNQGGAATGPPGDKNEGATARDATPESKAALSQFGTRLETVGELTKESTAAGMEARYYNESVNPPPDVRFRYVHPAQPPAEPNAETYAAVPENPFQAVATEPVSTFSIDVDTAAYANVRRFLNLGQRPPPPAVRIEEMVNYFRYDYPQPEAAKPFSVTVDLADCPWQPDHRLARVGLKGREIAAGQRPPSNLVFLIDVSGSMDEPNKLPLVQQSLRLLLDQLTGNDRVAMVTYAGNSGLALDSTAGTDRARIGTAIDQLAAGGSTNGASGIQLAYEVAQRHFVKEGVNRVLLATDGDFNVGVTSQEALQALITDRAKGGVFLSVLGYGMGNLKDSTMEMLADKGNGNYAYIDSLSEARKVLGEEMSGTLVTIAKDVKIQVEFNPALIRSYRLLGYENRMLARQDFNDDRKDAGEIGAGHTVTALYELVPVGAPPPIPPVDGLRYSAPPIVASSAPADARTPIDPAVARETMNVKLRYKTPEGQTSQALELPVVDREAKLAEAPADFKFAAGVTLFGLLLKDSAHKGNGSWDRARQLAIEGKGPDPLGYRGEFIQLIEKARGLAP